MNVAEILQKMSDMNAKLSVDGRDLVVEVTKGVMTQDAIEILSSHKCELMRHIRSSQGVSGKANKTGLCSGLIVNNEDVRLIEERLKPEGPGWAVIRSDTLDGQRVVWVRDHEVELPEIAQSLVKYTLDEIGFLAKVRPADLRKIHTAKKYSGFKSRI